MTGQASDNSRDARFLIEGRVQLEEMDKLPEYVQLGGYVFSRTGQLLGRGEIGRKGDIKLEFSLPGVAKPVDVDLFIAPQGDPMAIRQSSAYRESISADAWKERDGSFIAEPSIYIAKLIWWPWLPQRICVDGHVRKYSADDGTICPIPYSKVEIFDVDREFCWWPYIRRWWNVLLDRRVVRIPELLKEPKIPVKPFPEPDPVPFVGAVTPGPIGRLERVGINPQPEPPGDALVRQSAIGVAGLGPQPEPPDLPQSASAAVSGAGAFERVGEAQLLSPALATRFDNLTLTSRLAPWRLFPWCFYSRAKICETVTDENGYFHCCFWWWPFHFRRGRLRFDRRPDIIIRVTQVVDGVERVIYLDPYTSTRWNVTNAHIDLWLDDPDVVCGSGDNQQRPEGAQVFFTRIGDDEVYRIDQTSGLYSSGAYSNVAYGHLLRGYAQFGDALSDGGVVPGKYYRLSYAPYGSPESAFTPVTAELTDVRVNKVTNFSESHHLGPLTVNGTPALYEIRDTLHYLWYNPDLIGLWYSWLAEPDTAKYILRLEVFDQNGHRVNAPAADYRDGTVAPNGVLPPMPDPADPTKQANHCDLVITLDNKPPLLELGTPAVNECGVIPWSMLPPLNLQVSVSQENNRLYYWQLEYTKGVQPPPPHVMAKDVSYSGALSPVNVTLDAMHYPNPYGGSPAYLDMLQGVETTCAFALKLYAWPHIRNGRHFVYYREVVKAIAVEKCS